MTDLSIRISGIEKLDKLISETVFSREKVNRLRSEVLSVVQKRIDGAISKSRHAFNPENEDLVGELGVGIGGRPATEKLRNAWRLLQVGDGLAKLGANFQPKNLRRFGVIRYSLDKDKFYNHRLTTYRAQRSRGDAADTDVKWMENYILGIATPGFAYVELGEQGSRKGRSRTGLGHMLNLANVQDMTIPRRQFVYPGKGEPATFGVVLSNINKAVSSDRFNRQLRSIIAFVLRG